MPVFVGGIPSHHLCRLKTIIWDIPPMVGSSLRPLAMCPSPAPGMHIMADLFGAPKFGVGSYFHLYLLFCPLLFSGIKVLEGFTGAYGARVTTMAEPRLTLVAEVELGSQFWSPG